MQTDDLTSLRDDMIAFIEGHGLKRFRGFVNEDLNSVAWDDENPESWKDFVEVAKASGVAFLTMNDFALALDDVDYLVESLRGSRYVNQDDLEEARWLRSYIGRTGFLQLGLPYQGILFLYETSTDWYDRYQRLLELAEECGAITIDDSDQDDGR
jgi:hypothetical protein